jgi:hypothetical protein
MKRLAAVVVLLNVAACSGSSVFSGTWSGTTTNTNSCGDGGTMSTPVQWVLSASGSTVQVPDGPYGPFTANVGSNADVALVDTGIGTPVGTVTPTYTGGTLTVTGSSMAAVLDLSLLDSSTTTTCSVAMFGTLTKQ